MIKFIFLLASLPAWACPELQGTFHCRANPPFDVSIMNSLNAGYAAYTLTDPTGSHTLYADGAPHEMEFSQGKGQYAARCEGNSLIVEARGPNGEVARDRYYIERSALVRIRMNRNSQPQVLSCAPTKGTWRLYQR